MGDLNIQKGEVAMAKLVRMQMRKPVEELVMIIDLLCAPKPAALLANDVVQRAPLEVLEHHPDVLKRAEERTDVAVPRDGRVHAQLGEELRRDVLRVRLHLAVDLELHDVRLLHDALEQLRRTPGRDGREALRWVRGRGVRRRRREGEDGGRVGGRGVDGI